MTLRAVHKATHIRPQGRGECVELMEAMKQAFEIVAMAKVSTSALEAKGYGFISPGDRITMNRERVLTDAKTRALELAREGFRPLTPRTDIPAPGESILATLKMGVHIMRQGEFISDHEVEDRRQSRRGALRWRRQSRAPRSANNTCSTSSARPSSPSAARSKTQERIQYTLKTGKPLRN